MQNLGQVLNELGIKYKEDGDKYIIRCVDPNHEDRNPSMNVLKESGYFKCWSCGVSGSFKKFLSYFPGYVDNSQVLGWISQAKSNNWSQKKFAEFSAPKDYLVTIEGKLEPVWDIPLAMNFLRKRNCSKEFIDDFQIQYARNILVNRTEHYDGTSFTNRLIVPIYEDGKLVNLEGRTLVGAHPKVIYPKHSKTNCLFNWDRLNLDEMVYLTEGIMDLPNLYRITKNVTCTFGASLSSIQKERIKSIPKLCVIPDQDVAGAGMLREIDNLRESEYWVVDLPAGKKDAGECNQDELAQAINGSRRAVTRYMDQASFLQEEIRWSHSERERFPIPHQRP